MLVFGSGAGKCQQSGQQERTLGYRHTLLLDTTWTMSRSHLCSQKMGSECGLPKPSCKEVRGCERLETCPADRSLFLGGSMWANYGSVSLPPQGALQQLTFVMGDPAAAGEHCRSYKSRCTRAFNLNHFGSPWKPSPAWPEVWPRAADKSGGCWAKLLCSVTQVK